MAYGRRYPMQVRIARFENCYGPEGTWTGGREKAPAAICRKVAQAEDGGIIEVWGDGTAIRVFTYVDDLVDGIYTLMQSGLEGPVNISSDERVMVAELSMGAEAQRSKGAQEWRSKGDFTLAPLHPVSYTHLTLPTIYSV